MSEPTHTTSRLRRPQSPDGLLIVGLVGRAGSGKSTVARVLAAHGAIVVDADQLGHVVTDTDPEVREALVAEYGPQVYTSAGALDRRVVAAKVFRDHSALQRLNALVHPRIAARLLGQADTLRSQGFRGTAVVDAALMLDWGFERHCDAVLAVIAPEAVQIERLMRSRGWSEADARARLAVQRANEAFAAAADEVLDNHGSEAELEAATLAAIARLEARKAKG